jgi:hypothetical protein
VIERHKEFDGVVCALRDEAKELSLALNALMEHPISCQQEARGAGAKRRFCDKGASQSGKAADHRSNFWATSTQSL